MIIGDPTARRFAAGSTALVEPELARVGPLASRIACVADAQRAPSARVVAPRPHRTRHRAASLAIPLVVPLALLAAWLATTSLAHVFPAHQLPSPAQALATVVELARSGDLARHVVASIGRVLAGFALGSAAALAVGTLVGLSRTAERLLDPTLQVLRNVPSLAWVPFLLLWLGIDEAPKLTLIAIGAFFPVYLNLVAGIRHVDRKLVEVGYVFGLGRAALIRRIILPAARPHLWTGLRVALGQAWLFLVAAELIASTRGLGYLLVDGQTTARPDLMLVGILVLALLGKLSDTGLRRLERRALAWTDGFTGLERGAHR